NEHHYCHTSLSRHPHPTFFLNDAAPTEIHTLSLHDALPISYAKTIGDATGQPVTALSIGKVDATSLENIGRYGVNKVIEVNTERSEEHTSELQSRENLVCRLLLEKKNRYT